MDPEEIERLIQRDIMKSQKNKISHNEIKDWNKIENFFEEE
jgi:hypothetical protein